MGLTVYKPPDYKRKEHGWQYFFFLWVICAMIGVIGNDIGVWMHTGVWHW